MGVPLFHLLTQVSPPFDRRSKARKTIVAAVCFGLAVTACQGDSADQTNASTSASTAASETNPVGGTPATTNNATASGTTLRGPVKATVLGAKLQSPWGLAFLPDARMLITQKAGSMVIVSRDGARVESLVSGVPPVANQGQGGLLDVALDPDFARDPWVYFTFSEPGENGTAGTALARGRLTGNALRDVAVIWRQQPKLDGANHFGARIAFRLDKTLYVTVGERAQDNPQQPDARHAQNVGVTLGKVVRLARDGSVPSGNPNFDAGALPELWSIGHRNPQGAAVKPGTDELWLTEHGPQGGDELNRIRPGANYGWPLASYGCPYGAPVGEACRVNGGTHAPAYEEPISTWVPTSTAPAGMSFYSGTALPQWRGNVFVAALTGKTLWRIALDSNNQVVAREKVEAVSALDRRIRHVREGPDGWLYLLTDSGDLVRVGA